MHSHGKTKQLWNSNAPICTLSKCQKKIPCILEGSETLELQELVLWDRTENCKRRNSNCESYMYGPKRRFIQNNNFFSKITNPAANNTIQPPCSNKQHGIPKQGNSYSRCASTFYSVSIQITGTNDTNTCWYYP